jgi:ATP-dependent helicase/nuclease subunit B
LPVTAIETWLRDPYAVYARYVLRLRALQPIDADPGAAERGQLIHEALDHFVAQNRLALPPEPLAELLATGRATFGEMLTRPAVRAFWWPRFRRVAAWFLDSFEIPRRAEGFEVLATEINGRLDIAAPGGIFTLTAYADRIDLAPDGALAILDYKTGGVPSKEEVAAGFAPQLPLEGAIAEFGAFQGVRQARVGALQFVKLTGGNPPGISSDALPDGIDTKGAIERARAGLTNLITKFDDPRTPYQSKVQFAIARASDYDHLARVEEWAGKT